MIGDEGRLDECQFDFSARYPASLGEVFIEVHHVLPLGAQDQPRRTTFADLLLVCSNCHRMIHRTRDVDANLFRQGRLTLGSFSTQAERGCSRSLRQASDR